MGLVLRFGAIFIGILVGFLIYQILLRPLVLKPLCLVDTQECLSLSYYNIDNTVLVNVEKNDYTLWYNGKKIYLYEPTLGLKCSPSIEDVKPLSCDSKACESECIDGICGCDPSKPLPLQPAYEIDIANVTEVPKGYVCIRALPCVQHYYKSKAKKNYIVIRRSNPDTFSVTDLVNELIKRKIIHL